jgi:hypothetical protein
MVADGGHRGAAAKMPGGAQRYRTDTDGVCRAVCPRSPARLFHLLSFGRIRWARASLAKHIGVVCTSTNQYAVQHVLFGVCASLHRHTRNQTTYQHHHVVYPFDCMFLCQFV